MIEGTQQDAKTEFVNEDGEVVDFVEDLETRLILLKTVTAVACCVSNIIYASLYFIVLKNMQYPIIKSNW